MYFSSRERAYDAAIDAAREDASPQILVAVNRRGTVIDWTVVCTESIFNRQRYAFATVIDISKKGGWPRGGKALV